MKLRIPLGIAVAFAACVTFKLVYSAVAEPTSTDDVQIKRGQYLVERVAMCADCHTPRTEKGEIDKAQWLQGNTLDFKPLHPMPFVAVAPRIAGLPTMPTDEAAIRFFETGTNAAGKIPNPPMPGYRFDHQDATAVVAYLRSLRK